MNYKEITSASPDWFFVQDPHHFEQSKAQNYQATLILFPIAVWATNADGQVVGLSGYNSDSKQEVKVLDAPAPAVPGIYKHLRDFSHSELEALSRLPQWADYISRYSKKQQQG